MYYWPYRWQLFHAVGMDTVETLNIFQTIQLNLVEKKGQKVELNPLLLYNGIEVKNRFIKYL